MIYSYKITIRMSPKTTPHSETVQIEYNLFKNNNLKTKRLPAHGTFKPIVRPIFLTTIDIDENHIFY